MAVASDQITANAAANDAVTGIAGISADSNAVQPQEPAVDAKKQVFAGNLAFTTTEADLKELFNEVGSVANIQIITRGTRSLGYCFVTYDKEEDAAKAVGTLNKRVVAGREINVEGAKPQEELAAAKEEKRAAAKARKDAKAAERKEQQAAKAAAAEANGEATEAPASGKGRNKPRSARARRPRADDGEEADKVEADGAANGNGPAASTSAKKNKKSKAKKAAVANGEVPPVEGAKRPKQPRAPKGAPEGEASKTLLFVANLSFDVDDAGLKEAFQGLNVSTSHVVRRQFGAKRSKGFGFVDFASEQDQQKALSEYNGKEWQGRPLSLKVAIQGSKEQADKESKDEAVNATQTQAPSAEAA